MRRPTKKDLITQSALAKRLGVSRQRVNAACAVDGRIHAAVVKGKIEPAHPSVLEWIAERSGLAEGDAPTSQAGAPRLEELQRLTLADLQAQHADVRGLRSWLRAVRDAEEAARARMLRLRVQGRLIPVATVERMFDALDGAFILLLTDTPRTLATRIAPERQAEVTRIAKDLMSQHLTVARDRMVALLEANDRLAPIPVPTEEIQVQPDQPPWRDT